METLRFDIRAGDFRAAGAASSALKQHLKRLGAEGDAVRRATIAAYEAEMNVVIHADGGVLEATVAEDQLDVDVRDTGPGIADVALAMREGYSTAPAEARAMGFGAGMGLPNIERNSDRLRVTSTVGQGTTVSFTVRLRPERTTRGERPESLAVRTELCRDCRRCVTACPTGAVRVRDARPLVLRHLCVDCAACIAACAPRALDLSRAGAPPADTAGVTLVVPPGVLVDCAPYAGPDEVLAALRGLGYGDVVVTDGHESALRAAVAARAAGAVDGSDAAGGPGSEDGAGAARLPVISPVCPAAVALVELRFPALLPHVAGLCAPLEAAQAGLTDSEAVFVAACPAQRSALLLAPQPTPQRQVIGPDDLRTRLLPLLAGSAEARVADRRPCGAAKAAEAADTDGPRATGTGTAADGVAQSDAMGDTGAVASAAQTGAASDTAADDAGAAPVAGASEVLVVTGACHVTAVLDELENGLLSGPAVIEPYMCDGGCLGSPLHAGDPYVAAWRLAGLGPLSAGRAHARPRPFSPRPGIRLDADMAQAIRKLAELDRELAALPGKDCGACGAPTCAAFAEDVVTGRAVRDLCTYLTPPHGGAPQPDEGSTP